MISGHSCKVQEKAGAGRSCYDILRLDRLKSVTIVVETDYMRHGACKCIYDYHDMGSPNFECLNGTVVGMSLLQICMLSSFHGFDGWDAAACPDVCPCCQAGLQMRNRRNFRKLNCVNCVTFMLGSGAVDS